MLIPTAVCTVVMVAIHSVTSGPHWAFDLLATGAIGGGVYYATLVFYGLTPGEKASVSKLVGKARGRQRTPVG